MIAVRAPAMSGPPRTLPESLRDDWQRLTAPTTAAALFTRDLLDGLPEPVRRWLTHAIAPGTPLRRAAVLRQHGEIKVGRWLRYEADWVLAPPEEFTWAATSHFGPLFIRGFDRYTRGTGQLRWRLFGRIPFLSLTGPDVSRSALGRLAGELCFVPAAALSPAVRWEPLDDRRALACVDTHGWTHRVTLAVAESGQLERVDLPRWGNPDAKESREHLFTALLDGPEETFDGFSPSQPAATPDGGTARTTARTRSSSGSPSTTPPTSDPCPITPPATRLWRRRRHEQGARRGVD